MVVCGSPAIDNIVKQLLSKSAATRGKLFSQSDEAP